MNLSHFILFIPFYPSLDLTVRLVKDVLPKLATKATLSIFDIFERKIPAKSVVRAGEKDLLYSFKKKIQMILLKLQ